MAKALAVIRKSVNNGPFTYTFEVEGALQNVITGLANLGATLDSVKPLISAVPGVTKKITIAVVTDE
jgi:hypothetical protein